MIKREEISAIILAGGKSSRMGEDKRFLRLSKIPLLEYSVQLAGAFTDDIIISSNEMLPAFSSYIHVADKNPFEGPVNAIVSSLHHVAHENAIVLTCDMPFLTPEITEQLVTEIDGKSVVHFSAKNEFMHFPCIFPFAALAQLEQLYASGQHSMKSILKKLPVKRIPIAKNPPGIEFLNINRPEDFLKAKELLK